MWITCCFSSVLLGVGESFNELEIIQGHINIEKMPTVIIKYAFTSREQIG
jgi:hypothetical protein